jgi:hypothetical protein
MFVLRIIVNSELACWEDIMVWTRYVRPGLGVIFLWCFAGSILLHSIGCSPSAGVQQPPKAGSLAPPTNPRDLVLFIAYNQPSLHRIVGSKAIPFGTARFEIPWSIVADPNAGCFYVLDTPSLLANTVKIWRISPEGAGSLVFQAHYATQGGPFNDPISLGLDRQGRVLVADSSTGLWRLENGRLQRLFDGKNKPLHIITAATEHPTRGLLLGTSYRYDVTGGEILDLPPGRFRDETWSPSPSHANLPWEVLGEMDDGFIDQGSRVDNSSGRQTPIRVWQNQGGLFLADISNPKAKVTGVIVNQRPGGQEYETYWRTLTQVMIDSAGRIILIDAGRLTQHVESVYISPSNPASGNLRSTTTRINGGVFVMHPDGRFEDLTFKTPSNNSGPMQHPHGLAQWSSDTYIVADPDLSAQGINGTGGLLLLKLDGQREARWAFGARLKPMGVAILRGAGPAVAVANNRPIVLNELAGLRIAGRITRIDKVSWERKPPSDPQDLLAGIRPWQTQPPEQAENLLRSLFEGARWDFGADGSLVISARGTDPAQQGTPHVVRGKIVARGDIATATTSYFRPGDLQIGSVDAEIQIPQPGILTMQLNITMYTNGDRLKATCEQTIPLQAR